MINEHDRAIIGRAMPLLHPGEVLLHMGVARNDANMAAQIGLAAAVGVKIVPKMYYLVTTNHRLIAFETDGRPHFSGPPDPRNDETQIVEWAQSRITNVGKTTLGGRDLYFATPQGERRYNVVSSLSTIGSGGPSTQHLFYNTFPDWVQQQYQTGFAHVAQTPTLEQLMGQLAAQQANMRAQAAWQSQRRKHPRRARLDLFSIVLAGLLVPAAGALLYYVVEYNRVKSYGEDERRPDTFVTMNEKDLADIRSGVKPPPSYETKEQAIARLEKRLAELRAENTRQRNHGIDMYNAAVAGLAITSLLGVALTAGLVVLRRQAGKTLRYVDEDPALAPVKTEAPPQPHVAQAQPQAYPQPYPPQQPPQQYR